jgi:hypothetical protein
VDEVLNDGEREDFPKSADPYVAVTRRSGKKSLLRFATPRWRWLADE